MGATGTAGYPATRARDRSRLVGPGGGYDSGYRSGRRGSFKGDQWPVRGGGEHPLRSAPAGEVRFESGSQEAAGTRKRRTDRESQQRQRLSISLRSAGRRRFGFLRG